MANVDLAIVGLGMVSSVGHDVINACASIRAGLARPAPLSGYDVVAVVGNEPAPINVHRITGVSEGFGFLGLWVRLADYALRDLIAYARLTEAPSSFWQKTAILCITPVVDARRFVLQEDDEPQELLGTYEAILGEVLDLPVQSIQTVPGGPSGAAPALDRASAMLAAQTVERVVIVAVDSLADAHSIDWLAKADRLKSDERPDGLAPGEAGACIMLETEASARARGAVAEGWIRRWTIAVGQATESSRPAHHQGKVLAESLLPLLEEVSPFGGDIYSDQNGEVWRAQEAGSALIRLRPHLRDEVSWHYPATSIGDIGAASALAFICLGVRSLVRGYAKQDRVLVSCLSERGHGAAIAIDRS